ncbi:KOW motif-containing protein [Qipengyuania nanhaisediminis]|uniref:KOW motif-containing protein n=1 Tax=Qipengyuania nanhaisediminis TaxID=604088 RepID=UPI0038B3347E
MTDLSCHVSNGDHCQVVGGKHKGRAGTVEDLNRSAGGNLTISVREDGGGRFKTLARNVVKT